MKPGRPFLPAPGCDGLFLIACPSVPASARQSDNQTDSQTEESHFATLIMKKRDSRTERQMHDKGKW